jgi:hypothetical protein
MFNCNNNKYIETFNKSKKYFKNIFPGQSLMDLQNNIKIDYKFNNIEIPILEDDNIYDINNLDINYGFMDEIFSNNKINYNPKNASEIYEINK